MRHDLASDLPHDESPVIVNPFLGDKLAAFELQPLKRLNSTKGAGVFANKLVVVGIGEVEAPDLVRPAVSCVPGESSQSHPFKVGSVVEARIEEGISHSLAIGRFWVASAESSDTHVLVRSKTDL